MRLGDKGFISMGWMELGTRHITNSQRPIKSVADLKGLKIRLQPNETHLATFRAMGANAVAMDPKELYSALEQKVIDGQENPYQIIFANRYGEVQKYLSDSAHFFDFISVVANRKQFEALKPEYQSAVRQAMAAAVAHQRKLGKIERSALTDLDMDAAAEPAAIRARYTELLRRFHPDLNGGDRGAEGKLQRVIKAYKTLKAAGLA